MTTYLLATDPGLDETGGLSGKKIAIPAALDDSILALFSALGAAPVSFPVSEFYAALQTGVVDAVLLPETTLLELGPSSFSQLGVTSFLVGDGFLAGNGPLQLARSELPADKDGQVDRDSLDDQEDAGTTEYFGSQNSYTLTFSPTSTTISDRRTDGNGADTLINVEFLDFDIDLLGGPFDLSQFGGTTGLSEQSFESFIELYIAYFNRAPDAVGLNFWGTAFANGTSLEEIATLFANQEETEAAYPGGTTNETFATTVYNNVLGRIPDQDGLDFWVGQLDSGNIGRDQFILEVLRGVQPGSPDRNYLDTKVDVGAYFAVHKGMSDTDNAAIVMELFDASGVDAAVGAIDGYYADALDPNNGEFLMPVIGVLDDPFSAA